MKKNIISNMRVRNLEDLALLVRDLGYKSELHQLQFRNGASASDLFDFFEDNPGALEAVVDWIHENYGDEEDEEDTE